MPPKSAKPLIIVLALVVVALLGYLYLTTPDNRSTGDRIGDAFHALPQGPGKAVEQLEDRTPGQKLGDKIKDSTGSDR